jgi:hypothetical protein
MNPFVFAVLASSTPETKRPSTRDCGNGVAGPGQLTLKERKKVRNSQATPIDLALRRREAASKGSPESAEAAFISVLRLACLEHPSRPLPRQRRLRMRPVDGIVQLEGQLGSSEVAQKSTQAVETIGVRKVVRDAERASFKCKQ